MVVAVMSDTPHVPTDTGWQEARDRAALIGETDDSLSGPAIARAFVNFVVEQVPGRHTQSFGDLQECQHSRIATSMLDIDQSAKTQVAEVGEFFQTQLPRLAKLPDAQAEHKQSRVGWIVGRGHDSTESARRSANHEQLCIIDSTRLPRRSLNENARPKGIRTWAPSCNRSGCRDSLTAVRQTMCLLQDCGWLWTVPRMNTPQPVPTTLKQLPSFVGALPRAQKCSTLSAGGAQ